MATKYRCECCGATISTDVECPKCGCSEIYEVEDEYLSDDEVFDLVESGEITNL
jgi:protein-arginine kinase activator protein McsA